VGQGTTFKIYLPRTDEDVHREISSIANGTLTRGGETLLLVEDEETVREMTASILRECGYNVLEAAHGMEALDIVGTCECDISLLITDVIMPGMNGREVVDRLRVELPHLGVLYISGYTEEAVAQHGVLSPDAAFMSKPFSPATLTSKVREILDADHINARRVTEAFEG
jgi:CheY-like chemotaxis protein